MSKHPHITQQPIVRIPSKARKATHHHRVLLAMPHPRIGPRTRDRGVFLRPFLDGGEVEAKGVREEGRGEGIAGGVEAAEDVEEGGGKGGGRMEGEVAAVGGEREGGREREMVSV